MNKNKHCVLDITPSSVEKLQYAQYCPIVIYVSVESRSRLKELRTAKNVPKVLQTLSTRKLIDTSQRVAKMCPHLFTGSLYLNVKLSNYIYLATLDATRQDHWFDALKDLIAHLQVIFQQRNQIQK